MLTVESFDRFVYLSRKLSEMLMRTHHADLEMKALDFKELLAIMVRVNDIKSHLMSLQDRMPWLMDLMKLRSFSEIFHTADTILSKNMHAYIVSGSELGTQELLALQQCDLLHQYAWSMDMGIPVPQDALSIRRLNLLEKWLLQRILPQQVIWSYSLASEHLRTSITTASSEDALLIYQFSLHIFQSMQRRLRLLRLLFIWDIFGMGQWVKEFSQLVNSELTELKFLYQAIHLNQVERPKLQEVVVDANKVVELTHWPKIYTNDHFHFSWARKQLMSLIPKVMHTGSHESSKLWLFKLMKYYQLHQDSTKYEAETMHQGMQWLLNDNDQKLLTSWLIQYDMYNMQKWVVHEIRQPYFSSQLAAIIAPKIKLYVHICPWLVSDWQYLVDHSHNLHILQNEIMFGYQSCRETMLLEKYGWVQEQIIPYCEKDVSVINTTDIIDLIRLFGIWATKESTQTKGAILPLKKITYDVDVPRDIIENPNCSASLRKSYLSAKCRSN